MAIMPLLGIPFRYNPNLPARYGPYGPPPANPYAVEASSQLGPFAQGAIPQQIGPFAQGPVGWTNAPMTAIGGVSNNASSGAGGAGAPMGALGPASAVQQAAQQVGGQAPGARLNLGPYQLAESDLAPAAEAAAQTAPTAGRLGGLLGRIGEAVPGLSGDLSLADLGPAAAYFGGGQLAGSFANNLLGGNNPNNTSNTPTIVSDIIKGAGTGAGIGSLFEGVGAIPGALLGGAVGGASAVIGRAAGAQQTGGAAVKDELGKATTKLAGTLSAAGVPAALQQNAMMQMQLGAQGLTSRAQVRQLSAQIGQQLGPQLAQQKYQMAMAGAVQSWLGPMMQQQLNQQQFYANQEGSAMKDIASQMPDAGSRATAAALAAAVPANAAQSAAGQLLTMANSPYALGAGGYGQAVQQTPAAR